MRDRDCVTFLQEALPRLRLRWAGFRKVRRQVCRRIARRLAELGIEDLGAYRERLEGDPGEWRRLDELCRVTISRFFRDRRVFDDLRRWVLPELVTRAAAAGREGLAVWSAGCASGEEPYSLAISWRLGAVAGPRGPALKIVASDTDSHLLDRARSATYPPGTLREVPSGWRDLAFEERDGLFRLRSSFVESVDFRHEDLRRSPPPGRFDLVLCRNLAFTYYVEDLQLEVLGRIAAALRPGGALVIGCHESLPAEGPGFEPWPEAGCCYTRLP